MNRTWMLLACLLLASHPAAAGEQAPPDGAAAESVMTMRVDGDLVVGTEGRVVDYEITTELPDELRGILDKAVRGWTFQPMTVAGQPVQARNRMRVTLAAREVGAGYALSVDNVTFQPATKPGVARANAAGPVADDTRDVIISASHMEPPRYPRGLMRARVEGAVLVYLRVAPDGSVQDAVVVQSSLLNVRGYPKVLEQARKQFENSALAAARRWRFDVDVRPGASVTPAALTVTVPVWYAMRDSDAHEASGKWRVEVRGARHQVPWLAGARDAQRIGISDVGPGDLLALDATLRPPEGVIGRAL